MQVSLKLLFFVGVVWLAGAAAAPEAEAQARAGQNMERCVQRVLTKLARTRVPETQVGSAVLTQCDGPLRARLADAIRRGEAAGCTVESCLDTARSRAAAEAIAAYRQMRRR